MLHSLPPGLTEADVIDLIDGGGSVPREREGVILEALRADPRLGLLVKRLRADRAALQAAEAPVERAPANLIDLIDARLDRAALSELVHEAEEATAPIPISAYQPARPGGRGVLALLAESVWARRLATAASLAVVGGLGWLGVREVVRQWPRLAGHSTIARTDGVPAGDAAGAEPATGLLASGAPDEGGGDESGPALAATQTPGLEGSGATTGAAVAEDAPLTMAAAVRLAQEGRLVIAVRSRHLASTLRHLEGLSRASGSESRWRAFPMNNVPTELAGLTTPLGDVPAGGVGGPVVGNPPWKPPEAIASETVGPPAPWSAAAPGPGGTVPLPTPARPVVKSISVVRLAAEAQRLGDLLADLNGSKEQRAELKVLPESAALDQRPSLDPDAVLWWSAGPESWRPRITVPIVVEVLE